MLTLYDRLDAKLEPEANSGCLLWAGGTNTGGYGSLSTGGRGRNRVIYAHRLSYERAFGALPEGAHVCHKCDTPQCCNPNHLFAGSPRDNSDDKIAKGRHAFGERSGSAKLTERDVVAIRQDVRAYSAIAKSYGIGVMTVCWVKRRVTWKHVA